MRRILGRMGIVLLSMGSRYVLCGVNLYVPIKEVLGMYDPFHEMDIRQFVDAMNVLYKERKKKTNLKIHRHKAGLSQKELAELAGIPIQDNSAV